MQALGRQHLNQLLARLRHVTGFALDLEALQASLSRSSGEIVSDDSLPQGAELQHWKSLFAAAPQSLAPPGAMLLALLIAWDRQPYRLLAAKNATPLILRVARQLLLPVSEPGNDGQPTGVLPSNRSSIIDQPSSSIESTQTTSLPSRRGDQQASIDASVPSDEGRTPDQAADEQSPTPGQQQFITQCGGFYYLLNLLRQPALLAVLEQPDDSPWQHLYLISRLLDIELDLPLLGFLAGQLQVDDIQGLAALHPHRLDQRLLELAAQRMAHHPFWPHALIRKTARVRHDRAHLDIDFHSNSVDLEVRLAGLDVNPGWLPWLGRVVSFHYIDDPVLQGGMA
jgi:hypothetical protein